MRAVEAVDGRPLYETAALQHPAELDAFVNLIARDPPGSYLEVGAFFGGTLWRVAQVMRPRSRIVAVEKLGGHWQADRAEPALEACMARLQDLGHDTYIVWGDSTEPAVVETVRKLAPFDLALIDANHTARYVHADWRNYGPLCRAVAFHDICWRWRSPLRKDEIAVPELWASLRDKYRSAEIKLDPGGKDNGIGVLWRD